MDDYGVLENPRPGYTILDHSYDIAHLLGSEWEQTGYVRSWHAIYRLHGVLVYASIVQRRNVEGFQAGLIYENEVSELHSSAAFTVAGACVWLGLMHVSERLDWRHEL